MGAYGQLTRGSNGLSPKTKYKRSKNAFAVSSIALSLAPLGTKLLELPAQSPVGSTCTRVPGLPIRNCADIFNNLVQRGAKGCKGERNR